MKKILHVVSCLDLGGTESFIMNNYRNINKENIQFDFLVFIEKDYPYLNEIKRLGGKVFFAIIPSVKNYFKFYKIFKKIVLENGPYNAVHCHVNLQNAIPLICAKKIGIKKRVSHSHAATITQGGILKKISNIIKKSIVKKNATDFLACSQEAGSILYGEKLFYQKGVVINNGIDVRQCFNSNTEKIESLKREFNILEKGPVIGNISRFDNNKNQEFLIDVFKELLKLYSNAVLILGGIDKGNLKLIAEKVRNTGIEENVRFIGPRDDVIHCLQVIDIYAFPSIHEGLGIALLEAQAAGCLCFASNGVPRTADMDIGNVHFVELSKSPMEWADKIANEYKIYAKPEKEKILIAFENKGFDIVSSARELEKIYEK